MNIRIYTILLISLGLVVGIGLGYLLFGHTSPHSHNHSSHNDSAAENGKVFTCSMHPQIRQNEPGLCPICGMDLIPANEQSETDPSILKMTQEAVQLANIQTTVIGETRNSKKFSLSLTGKIQSDERRATNIVAHIPGRIEQLFVSFTGETVTKGQKVARIYSPELVSAQQELLEAVQLKETNPYLVEAARNKLRYWKIGERTIQSIETKGNIQETFILYAAESGIVSHKNVSTGDYLKKGEVLFALDNLDKLWVFFDAYEEDLVHVKEGSNIVFSTPAVPNRKFNARITFINPVIDPTSRTISLRAEVNNALKLLKPEMLVWGQLQKKGKQQQALSIPKSAILWTGKRSVVYIKLPDHLTPTFQYKEVELGESIGDNYLVVSGINNGDEVVTHGSFAIDAAAQLNNQMSMINKNVLIKGVNNSNLPDFSEAVSIEFKTYLTTIVSIYIELKDAFVATNKTKAKEVVGKLINNLSEFSKESINSQEARMYWTNEQEHIHKHSEQIKMVSTIDKQRKQFEFLSKSLIKTVKVFGLQDQTYYVQHCPMANNNKGADWLSQNPKILNPYFGDRMLSCGIVKDTLSLREKKP